MKPVGICIDLLSRQRSKTTEIPGWEDWLQNHNIPYEYVDCYDYEIISKLDNYSALLWHYGNYVNADLMEAQNILNLAASRGLKVYPDNATAWHFDDKIAEMYALQSVGAPIPESWVFYELDKCENWLKTQARYPLVAKLRRGSGSNNVKLLHNEAEALRYARRMFSRGYSPAQSLLYKTYSKVQSTRSLEMFKKRFKQIPNFLKARRFGKGLPVEKGYCYFQEFIENDGYDIKVTVVDGKCSFFCRNTRKGSFKASGGGDFFYDHALISSAVVESALKTADDLNLQCVGFDYVVDRKTGQGLIIEMCHGFDENAVYACGGYWDRDLVWHDEPLNVKFAVLEELFKEASDT